MAAIARECAVSAKLAESHFTLLEDLLLATRVPVFARRAARRLASHPKFYFFDAGVYRTLRPRGPLDGDSEIDGPSLETVFLANVRAVNDAEELGYGVHYWRTAVGAEVDFVLYGERGLLAFEIKRSDRVRDEDLASLRAFAADYPEAKCFLLHGGRERRHAAGVEIAPLDAALRQLPELLRDAALPPPLRA
jgi:predicted AAA+ superfamily ATPase